MSHKKCSFQWIFALKTERQIFFIWAFVREYLSSGFQNKKGAKLHVHPRSLISVFGLNFISLYKYTIAKLQALKGNFGYCPRAPFLQWETGNLSFEHFQIRINTVFRYAYARWIFPHFLDKMCLKYLLTRYFTIASAMVIYVSDLPWARVRFGPVPLTS